MECDNQVISNLHETNEKIYLELQSWLQAHTNNAFPL